MVQDVFLKTSQAFVPIGKVAKGDNATFGGQHWLVSVGRFHYESMSVDGLNKARHTAGTGHTRDGTVLVGQTTKTEAQLAQFASDWNKRGQKGSHKYCVVDNSCQHFAKELINYACNGRYTIPESFGGRFVIEPGRVDVSFGTGELVATRAGPVDAHISGPAIGAHGSCLSGPWMRVPVAFRVLGCALQGVRSVVRSAVWWPPSQSLFFLLSLLFRVIVASILLLERCVPQCIPWCVPGCAFRDARSGWASKARATEV